MLSFTHDGLALAFDDIAPAGGHERTIVLVHGFSSNRHEGWRRTGWYAAFERRRMRCIALDLRGHGESDKPHDVALYGREAMAGDVLTLLDHLQLERVDLFGFSMGAHMALQAALTAPGRISNLILGGVGARIFEPRDEAERAAMAAAMLADDPEAIGDPMLRSFRHFADEQGEDRRALAAATRAVSPPWVRDELGAVGAPVLVAAGQRDDLAGDIDDLAAAFVEGYAVSIPGCDHFSAIPHALTKAAVFDFLDGMMDPNMP